MTGSLSRRHFSASAIAACLAGRYGLAAAATPAPATILVVGDSLSAEYGLRRGTGWVALLQKRLEAQKLAARVVNASISGDTTSGGRSRLAPLLKQHKPDVLVIELGGNDALRGLPPAMTRANLEEMVAQGERAGARVLLVGMQMPPNYGADYTKRFAQIYADLARERRTGLVPFMLEGVADRPDARSLFQGDGIHPTEQAHPRILDNIWPELRKLLVGAKAGGVK